jgi:hypothetical protein
MSVKRRFSDSVPEGATSHNKAREKASAWFWTWCKNMDELMDATLNMSAAPDVCERRQYPPKKKDIDASRLPGSFPEHKDSSAA